MTENPETYEHEIHNPSPSREVNPVQFFAPGGNPVVSRDFRPTTFVFDNTEEEVETEDGHGNMTKAVPHVATHPSENHRRIRGRESSQQELNFDPDLIPDGSGEPQTDEEKTERSEEPKQAPGIAGSKQTQPQPE